MSTELEQERAALVQADQDIANGRARIVRQEELVSGLRAKGYDSLEAERLVDLLRVTLTQWEAHRTQIEERIAYLAAKRLARD